MSDPLAPLPSDAFDFKAAQHLLNRAGFGGRPAQIRSLVALGLSGATNSFFPPRSKGPKLAELARSFRSDIIRTLTIPERNTLQAARANGDEDTIARFSAREIEGLNRDSEQARRLGPWWLNRMAVEAENAFEEKMVLFWHGHFATGFTTVRNSWHLLMQQDLFRSEHAGSFARLLRGIVRDPAMIKYLDSEKNSAREPNENLARELFELFSMGEGNGYTEADIKEAARALSGWTIRDNSAVFDPTRHDKGTKTVLGQSGPHGSDAIVTAILRRPEPPRLIARKLYRFFVNDHPNPGPEADRVIGALAAELRKSAYVVKPVLLKLFRSAHFYAEANRLSVIKSPVQLVAQLSRSLGTPARSMDFVHELCTRMAQRVFEPPSVKGWDGGRAWCSAATMAARQNASVYMLTGLMPVGGPGRPLNDGYSPSTILSEIFDGSVPSDDRTAIAALAEFVLATPLDSARLDAIMRQLQGAGRGLTDDAIRRVLCLLTSLPEYQLC